MTSVVVITAPSSERDAINESFFELGYGENTLNIPLTGDRFSEEGETPTHYTCNWPVGRNENSIQVVESLRDTLLKNCTVVVKGKRETQLPRIAGDIADSAGTFNVVLGDNIVLTHKEFNPGQWGWRAEMRVQSESFDPGVRAVAIYSDPEHTQFLYTTGAFAWDAEAERWATQWNDGRPAKADVHWAVLFASLQEAKGTLSAEKEMDALFLRFGLPE